MKYYYGAKSLEHVKATALHVTRALDTSAWTLARKYYRILVGTSAAETHCGTYPDRHPSKLGVGICQCDEIGLIDVQQRLKPHHDAKIKAAFGIDVSKLKLEDLAYDIVVAFIVCRLYYKGKEQIIPETDMGQALYWKRHYNTEAGDGTAEQYLKRLKYTEEK